jgi:Glucodextranase, domain B
MPSAKSPQETIRSYLAEHGGVEVPVDDLVVTWRLGEWNSREAARIAKALAEVGVEVLPRLTRVGAQDRVLLRLRTGGDAEAGPVWLRVRKPRDGAVCAKRSIVVKGLVSPPGSAVKVNGEPVECRDGRFAHRVQLSAGENHVEVLAERPGVGSTTASITVAHSPTAAADRSPMAQKLSPRGRSRSRS